MAELSKPHGWPPLPFLPLTCHWAVYPEVVTAMLKLGVFLRQRLASCRLALADDMSCSLPDHLCRCCQLTQTQSESIFLSNPCSVRWSYSKTARESSFTVFRAAQGTFSILGRSIFSRTFPNTARRGQVESGSSINKAKKVQRTSFPLPGLFLVSSFS